MPTILIDQAFRQDGHRDPLVIEDHADVAAIDRALGLARQALGRSSPNPAVGCVITRDGAIVGEGHTQPPGQAHAEVMALRHAGERASGATLYVTLEPCSHYGRTPPCCDAIIAAGVRRVVASSLDPDPRVNGRGIAALRAAGIAVEVGLGEAEAIRLNRGFFKFNQVGYPMVIAKWAMSLDGKIATTTGESRWITGEEARAYSHRLRDESDAILIGAQTAERDDPSLTVRMPADQIRSGRPSPPLRVVVDSRGRLPLALRLFNDEFAGRTLVATTDRMSPEREVELRRLGVRIGRFASTADGRVNLAALMRSLANDGVRRVLAEGGGQLIGDLFDSNLVDEVAVFVAPVVIGGTVSPGPVAGRGVRLLTQASRFGHVRVRRFGADLLFEGEVFKHQDRSADQDSLAPHGQVLGHLNDSRTVPIGDGGDRSCSPG